MDVGWALLPVCRALVGQEWPTYVKIKLAIALPYHRCVTRRLHDAERGNSVSVA